MKPPLIILAGPTASGKTALSVKLAKRIGGSVISADSMQVYRHMDIGSAKIRPKEMQGVPHYLIDELNPDEEFNIVLFQKLASKYMQEIYAAGRIPILVGGTGFYIQSVLYGIDFSEERASGKIREELTAYAVRHGSEALHRELEKVDLPSANAIHPNNIKRVIRALEFYRQNGYPISEHNQTERQKPSPYAFAYFVLNEKRELLYQKIERRVDQMLAQGLLSEVEALKNMGCHKGMVSMQGLGYKEILAYLEGELSLKEAIYRLKRDTRHFAKRQITWFKREREVIWLNKDEYGYDEDRILHDMIRYVRGELG